MQLLLKLLNNGNNLFRLSIAAQFAALAVFSAVSLMAILLFCEYALKPWWHLIISR